MRKFPELPSNYLWTLTESPGDGENGMTIGDNNGTFHMTAMPYLEDAYNDILAQTSDYKMVKTSVTILRSILDGDTEEMSRKSSDIMPNSIVVKDGSFAGIFTLCLHREEVHLHSMPSVEHQGILFVDGTSVGVNYDEFERNPGGFRYTETYSLEKRTNDKRII